jgi:hypothetical protein
MLWPRLSIRTTRMIDCDDDPRSTTVQSREKRKERCGRQAGEGVARVYPRLCLKVAAAFAAPADLP